MTPSWPPCMLPRSSISTRSSYSGVSGLSAGYECLFIYVVVYINEWGYSGGGSSSIYIYIYDQI